MVLSVVSFLPIVIQYIISVLQININICLQDNDNSRKGVVNLWNIRTYEAYGKITIFVSAILPVSSTYPRTPTLSMKTALLELTAERLVKLADFYNVSIDYLLGRTDNPEVNRN